MKVLVTGGAGFIGSHLVESLLVENNEVVVIDNFYSGRLSNLPKNKRLKIVKGNVQNFSLLSSIAKGCEQIYHLAEYIPETRKFGEGHIVKFSTIAPVEDLKVTVGGTLNILEVTRLYDCKIIFASSAAIYGKYRKKIKEEFIPRPISPYGVFKLTNEMLCNVYSKLYGIPFAIARIFNSYGPRQRKYLMYDILLKLKKNPKRLVLLGSGKQERDFIFVKDTVNALLLIAKKVKNQPINVGNGKSIKIIDVVRRICEIKKIKPKVCFSGKSWPGDIEKLVADNTKLKSLGYKQQYSLEKGLKELIKWFDKTE
jgi:UDP-glucose 4-epimerase